MLGLFAKLGSTAPIVPHQGRGSAARVHRCLCEIVADPGSAPSRGSLLRRRAGANPFGRQEGPARCGQMRRTTV